MAALKNIAGWTKDVWLQAPTNGSANNKELLKGHTSECTNEESVEHKEQNKKVKRPPSMLKKKLISLVVKNKIEFKIGGN